MAILLAPYRWDTTTTPGRPVYRRPVGTTASLDVRSLPNQSAPNLSAVGLFVGPATTPDATSLGATLNSTLTGRARSAWESLVGHPVPGTINRVAELITWALTEAADPSGDTRAKPVLTGRIVLQGQDVWRGEMSAQHRAHVIEVRRRDLIRMPEGPTRQRVLSTYLKKYGNARSKAEAIRVFGLDWDPLTPHTTLTDTFAGDGNLHGRTPSGGLGGTWEEFAGSVYTALLTTGGVCRHDVSVPVGRGRLNDDLSTDDHYCQLSIVTSAIASATRGIGPVVRYAAAAHTFYHMYCEPAGNDFEMYKYAADTPTEIGTNTANTWSLPDTVKIQIDGSTLSASVNGGADLFSTTDTAITGNVRCGIESYIDAGQTDLDDWEAADVGVAPPASTAPLSVVVV